MVRKIYFLTFVEFLKDNLIPNIYFNSELKLFNNLFLLQSFSSREPSKAHEKVTSMLADGK